MRFSDGRIEQIDYDGNGKLMISLDLGCSQCTLTRNEIKAIIAAIKKSPSGFTEKLMSRPDVPVI